MSWTTTSTVSEFRQPIESETWKIYAVFSLGLVFIMICMGLTLGGHLRFTFFPTIERDRVVLTAKMPFGTAVTVSREIEEKMINSAYALLDEYRVNAGREIHNGVYSNVGRGGSHNTSVRVYLKPLKERGFSTNEFSRKWRKNMGSVPGIESLNIRSGWRMGSTYDIDLQLSHPDPSILLGIVEEFILILFKNVE